MALAGTVLVKVTGDFTELQAKTAEAMSEMQGKFQAMGASGAQGFSTVGQRAEVLGAKMQAVGQRTAALGTTLSTRLTLPLAAAGYGVAKMIQGASDLAETQSKVGVVFGKSSREIEKWAATAAQSIGQSKQQAMDAASTFAIFGKSAGLTGGKLVQFSTGLTGVAADMASFANTTPEEAIDALGAALRGESEPIRRYGVLLDDATLRQQALKMGLIETTSEALTPQQRVLAAQAQIYKQLGKEGSNTIGDFARTSDSLANRQRILKAELQNTSDAIGTSLLPIALSMAKTFQNQVVPAITKLANWFRNLSPGMQQFIVKAGIAVAALGPFLIITGKIIAALGHISSAFGKAIGFATKWGPKMAGASTKAAQFTATVLKQAAAIAIQTARIIANTAATLAKAAAEKAAAIATRLYAAAQWLLNAAMSANPIGLVVIAIAALVAAVVIAYQKSETFRGIIDSVWGSIKRVAEAIWKFLKPAISVVFTIWKTYISALWKVWSTVFGAIIKIARKVFDFLKGVLGPVFSWLYDRAKTAFSNLKANFQTVVGVVRTVGGKIKDAFGAVVDWFGDKIDKMRGWIDSLIGWLKDAWDWISKVASGSEDAQTSGGGGNSGGNKGGNRNGGRIKGSAPLASSSRIPTAIPQAAAATGSAFAPEVRVFIGDQELTSIVRTQIVERDRRAHRAYLGGTA